MSGIRVGGDVSLLGVLGDAATVAKLPAVLIGPGPDSGHLAAITGLPLGWWFLDLGGLLDERREGLLQPLAVLLGQVDGVPLTVEAKNTCSAGSDLSRSSRRTVSTAIIPSRKWLSTDGNDYKTN
jgi:hypothetical protein